MSSYVVFEVPDTTEAVEKQTRSFECPCCGTTLQFLTRVIFAGIRPVTDADGIPLRIDMESRKVVTAATAAEIKKAQSNETLSEDGRIETPVTVTLPMQIDIDKKSLPKTVPKEDFSDDELSILKSAESSGVLKAFERALTISAGNKPLDIKPHFLKFLKGAVKKQKSRLGTEMILHACGIEIKRSDEVEMWNFNTVCGISVNGVIEIFLPVEFARGQEIEKISMEQGKVSKEVVRSGDWLRGGSGGYIGKGAGMFAAHLHSKSYGALSGD